MLPLLVLCRAWFILSVYILLIVILQKKHFADFCSQKNIIETISETMRMPAQKGLKLKDILMSFLRPMHGCKDNKPKISYELGVKSANHMKLLSIGVFVIVLLFGFVDALFVTDKSVYMRLNIARFVFAFGVLVPLIVFYLRNQRPVSSIFIALNFLLFSGYLIVLSQIAKENPQAQFHNTIGLALLTIYVMLISRIGYFALPLLLINTAAVNANVTRIFALNQSFPITTFDVSFWLIIISLFAFILGRQLEIMNIRTLMASYELEKASQARNKLFAVISHDLKNLISSQYGIVYYLHDSFKDIETKELERLVDLLKDAAKGSLSMFEDMVLWMKSQLSLIKPEHKEIIVENFVSEQVNHFALQLNSRELHVETVVQGYSSICYDETIIGLVFRNLIDNAIKYSQQQSKVLVDVLSSEDAFRVKVQDWGKGMSEDQVEKVLNIVKAHSEQGTLGESGSGIGLFLTKEILESIGGSITIESKVDEGTIVQVRIPLSGM